MTPVPTVHLPTGIAWTSLGVLNVPLPFSSTSLAPPIAALRLTVFPLRSNVTLPAECGFAPNAICGQS